MALTATVYNFCITLSDVDRSVYETLNLKAARQPSETLAYLLTRVLAYCLQYRDGITFTRGLAEPDEPAIWAHDLTGSLTLWLEIGAPSAERLHKASKLGAEVVVYVHKNPSNLLEQLRAAGIFRAEAIKVYSFPQKLYDDLEPLIERRTTLTLSVSDGVIYLSVARANNTPADFAYEVTKHSI